MLEYVLLFFKPSSWQERRPCHAGSGGAGCHLEPSVEDHLRELHGQVQTLCSRQADCARVTVPAAAVCRQAAAAVPRVEQGHQRGGLAATQVGAQGQRAGVTPRQRGPQAVQWIAKQACKKDGRTEVSRETKRSAGAGEGR